MEKWSLDTLPMIPERFQFEVTKSKYKQFNVVKQLLHNPQVTEIIHAGDAGREGELIVRNIINLCNVQKPMKRLWISSLTKQAIYQGFKTYSMNQRQSIRTMRRIQGHVRIGLLV